MLAAVVWEPLLDRRSGGNQSIGLGTEEAVRRPLWWYGTEEAVRTPLWWYGTEEAVRTPLWWYVIEGHVAGMAPSENVVEGALEPAGQDRDVETGCRQGLRT